jgi:hypothetical protein
MILDERNEFADATALGTSGTGRALVGDVIDLGAVSRDVGNGEPVYLVIQVDTAVTSGGSATVSFELASDAAAAIATDGSASVHFASAAIPKATLVAGYTIAVALPNGTYERYLGILQNVGTAALTAGKINAFLTHDVAKWVATDAPYQA